MERQLYRGKSVHDGKWVYGYYVLNGFGNSLILSGREDMCKTFDYTKVEPESVEQYRGKKDSNGKKIYEKIEEV